MDSMIFKEGDRVRHVGDARGEVYTIRSVGPAGTIQLIGCPWYRSALGFVRARADDNPNKLYPVARGLLDYFPDACLEVAHTSLVANAQHNPGEPMHWAKEKSQDEADACVRHLMKRGTRDTDGLRHSAKAAWRALANLQREIDAEREQP